MRLRHPPDWASRRRRRQATRQASAGSAAESLQCHRWLIRHAGSQGLRAREAGESLARRCARPVGLVSTGGTPCSGPQIAWTLPLSASLAASAGSETTMGQGAARQGGKSRGRATGLPAGSRGRVALIPSPHGRRQPPAPGEEAPRCPRRPSSPCRSGRGARRWLQGRPAAQEAAGPKPTNRRLQGWQA